MRDIVLILITKTCYYEINDNHPVLQIFKKYLNKYPTNIRESIRHAQKVEVPPQKKIQRTRKKRREIEREKEKKLFSTAHP